LLSHCRWKFLFSFWLLIVHLRCVKVLIKVHAAGVNPVDTYIRSGMFGVPAERLPFSPGFDCAGVVVHVGADVTKLKVIVELCHRCPALVLLYSCCCEVKFLKFDHG